MGCLLFVGLIIALAIALGATTLTNVVGGFRTVLNQSISNIQPTPVATVISTQTIVEGIQPLGQLVSISTQLAKADINVSIAQGALEACSFSADHVAQGTIQAGVDLTKLTDDDIQYNRATNTYVITLPPPELTSCSVDYIRQYNRSFTACAVDWDEARLIASYNALTQFRDDAIEGGVLSRAQTEAAVVVSNFVKLLTGSNVQIVFAPQNATPVLPSVCQPDVPTGWQQGPNGAWFKP
jgi:uncharacterized protein DUF4230